jgi:uncharacterized membrane protein
MPVSDMNFKKLISTTAFGMFVLFVLNLVLKAWHISGQQIAMDEPFTISASQRELSDIIHYLGGFNNPPLYELLLHFIVVKTGPVLPWVRMISLFASALTPAFVFYLGSRYWNKSIAWTGSLLFTFATYQVYFSHEARVYALFELLSCCSAILFLGLISGENTGWKKLRMSCFILVNTLLIYAHYFGFVMLFTEFVFLLFLWRRLERRKFYGLALHYLLYPLLYIPQSIVMFTRFKNASATHWVPPPSVEDLYINLLKFLNAPVIAFSVIVLLVVAGVFALLKKKGGICVQAGFLLTWFLLPYLLMFAVSFKMPVFLERYLIFLSVPIYILIPISIAFLIKNEKLSMSVQLIFLTAFIFTCNLNPSHHRNWEGIANYVRQHKDAETAIVLTPSWDEQPFTYYYKLDYFRDYDHSIALLKNEHIYALDGLNEQDSVLLMQYPRILFINGGEKFADKKLGVSKFLERNYSATAAPGLPVPNMSLYLKR